jgi:ribosomal-protein-alanine N-acetyltransferase
MGQIQLSVLKKRSSIGKRGFEDGWIIRWAIAAKENNRIIGTVFFNGFRDGLICETGYELSSEYCRKGVMTEVLDYLLPVAYHQMGINRLQAIVDPENIASIGLLRKLGFVEEGLLREYEVHRVTNHSKDMLMFSMLKTEFLNK